MVRDEINTAERIHRQHLVGLRALFELTAAAGLMVYICAFLMPTSLTDLVDRSPRAVRRIAEWTPQVWTLGGLLSLFPGTLVLLLTMIFRKPRLWSVCVYLMGAVGMVLCLFIDMLKVPGPLENFGPYALLTMSLGAMFCLVEILPSSNWRQEIPLPVVTIACTGFTYMCLVTAMVFGVGG